jgi:3-deoxy-D-manno-octulosonic-acid transferase
LKPFVLLYTLLAALLYLVALPFLLLLPLVKKKYRHAIPARFFLWHNPPLRGGGIWIHSCSFGEARAIRPLTARIPPETLRLSTTTQTGFAEISTQSAQSRYLPYELWLYLWIRPQKLLMVMEAELWYLLFFLARRNGTRTLLINARMNVRSYPKYLRLRWFYRRVFAQIDAVYAQSEEDKERLEALGAHNVKVVGNIKFAGLEAPRQKLRKPDGLLVCAGSTHQGEERLILDAFVALKQRSPDAKLLLAPRHPERFEMLHGMAEAYAVSKEWRYTRYSDDKSLESDLILIDSLGELIDLYAISDIVVLGGAFEPIGGHNAAEAAQFGCKIISGPHYFNQRDIFAGIEGITVVENEALAETLQYPEKLPRSRITREANLQPLLQEIDNVL